MLLMHKLRELWSCARPQASWKPEFFVKKNTPYVVNDSITLVAIGFGLNGVI